MVELQEEESAEITVDADLIHDESAAFDQGSNGNSFQQEPESNSARSHNVATPKSALRDATVNTGGTPEPASAKTSPAIQFEQTKAETITTTTSKQKPVSASSGVSGTSRMKGQFVTDIESKFSKDMKRKATEEQRSRDKAYAERMQRHSRYRIARSYAEPVERILEVYRSASTDLYDVLGVGNDISDLELRKTFRASALVVHPGMLYFVLPQNECLSRIRRVFTPNSKQADTSNIFRYKFMQFYSVIFFCALILKIFVCRSSDKNPHPDAKDAFDALQESFEALSTPTRRAQYDQEVRRQQVVARARRWNVRRLKKWLAGFVENSKSSLQLLHYELTVDETSGQKRDLRQSATLLWRRVAEMIVLQRNALVKYGLHLLEHYVLLPSYADRFQLLHQQWWKCKHGIFLLSSLLSSLFV